MLEFIQHCLNGLIIGGAYALIGVGMTLVLGIMRVINFAHGEFYMLGAYLCFTIAGLMGLNFFVGFSLAVLGVGLIGCLVPGIIAQEFERQGIWPSLLSLGIVTGILALVMLWFGLPVLPAMIR